MQYSELRNFSSVSTSLNEIRTAGLIAEPGTTENKEQRACKTDYLNHYKW